MSSQAVTVVGAGISGLAAAQQLDGAGVPLQVIDRGRRLGGRLGLRTLRDTGTPWDGHPVDLGAAYFTVSSPEFSEQVVEWELLGLARPWTDTLQVADGNGITGETTGPVRWSTPGGLRSLADQMAAQIANATCTHPREVGAVRVTDQSVHIDGEAVSSALLCAPAPQMSRILVDEREAAPTAAVAPIEWEPVLALIAVFDARDWPEITGVFVNGSDVLGFIADDGARRGDGAAVLVSHGTPEFSAQHLVEPALAGPAMVAATRRILGIRAEPRYMHVHRWSLARPASASDEPHYWDGQIGMAGDAWHGGPRVEAAWLSGRSLGRRVADTL